MKRTKVAVSCLAAAFALVAVSSVGGDTWQIEYTGSQACPWWEADGPESQGNPWCRFDDSREREGLFGARCYDPEGIPDDKGITIRVWISDLLNWRSTSLAVAIDDHLAASLLDGIASLGALGLWVQVLDPTNPDVILPLAGSDLAGNWALTAWYPDFIVGRDLALLVLPPNGGEIRWAFHLAVYATEVGGIFPRSFGFGHAGILCFRCWREK